MRYKFAYLFVLYRIVSSNAYAFSVLCCPWDSMGVSHSAECDQGLCPMEPTTFEKVDETFILRYSLLFLTMLSDNSLSSPLSPPHEASHQVRSSSTMQKHIYPHTVSQGLYNHYTPPVHPSAPHKTHSAVCAHH